MIRPLRTYHRWTFEILGVVLPVFFLAALAARPSATRPNTPATPQSENGVFATSTAWKKHAIVTSLYSEGSAVSLQPAPATELNAPDLLLYWSAETEPASDRLGKDAILLGAFEPNRRYPLPQAKQGTLILYSLAHRQVVDSAVLEHLQ